MATINAIICIDGLFPNGIYYEEFSTFVEKIHAIAACANATMPVVEEYEDGSHYIRVNMSESCQLELVSQGVVELGDFVEPEELAGKNHKILEWSDGASAGGARCAVC